VLNQFERMELDVIGGVAAEPKDRWRVQRDARVATVLGIVNATIAGVQSGSVSAAARWQALRRSSAFSWCAHPRQDTPAGRLGAEERRRFHRSAFAIAAATACWVAR
jgi:hypothetical protein